MSEENKKPITEAEAQAALCSKEWLAAVERGDRIGTYQMFVDWLATAKQGPLFLQQMGERICYALAATGDEEYTRQLADCALYSERFLQDERKAANDPGGSQLRPRVTR